MAHTAKAYRRGFAAIAALVADTIAAGHGRHERREGRAHVDEEGVCAVRNAWREMIRSALLDAILTIGNRMLWKTAEF